MRILIVKLGSIGDVVHTLPAAASLRSALPEARIAWAVDTRASEILRDSPAIDSLVELDTGAWRRQPLTHRTWSEARTRLREIHGVDVAIDFQGLIKSGLIALASRAKRRVGFEARDRREKLSGLFLTEQAQTAHFRNVIDKNLALASAVTPNVRTGPPYEFPISISQDDHAFASDLAADGPVSFALVNPGGGWPTKLWPPGCYARVADWLWAEFGMRSLVTFGPGEERLADSVASSARSGMARPVPSTLKQFAALALRAELFIGGDTGPLHIAAACGAPIVGLYGPTSPERNGPFNPEDVTVGRDLWCRPECHRRKCWHWECMEIPVDDVKAAIARRLKNAQAGHGLAVK